MPIDIERFESAEGPDEPTTSERIGEVPREFGRFFNDMETYRRRVDYGSGSVERGTEDLIQQTTEFLDVMRQLVVDESDSP